MCAAPEHGPRQGALKDNLANGKTVIPALEFSAKLNRELPPQQPQLDLEGEGEVTIRLTWGE